MVKTYYENYKKMFNSFFDLNSIEAKLISYNIFNYVINKDNSIDIDGDVNLSDMNLNLII